MVIVVINNDGGGIFHFLPVRKETKHFEQFFATPHGFHFEAVAGMFGITYARPASMTELCQQYDAAADRGGRWLFEIATNREANLRLHRQISEAIRESA